MASRCDPRPFLDSIQICPSLLSVTDNSWRTPLHQLLYRGHTASALRILAVHSDSLRLDQVDISGESVASLIESQRQVVFEILWTHLSKKQFAEFHEVMKVMGR